jgi:hypothetical protein
MVDQHSEWQFEESVEAVDALSVLLLMAPTRKVSSSTEMILKVFEMGKDRWRLRLEKS